MSNILNKQGTKRFIEHVDRVTVAFDRSDTYYCRPLDTLIKNRDNNMYQYKFKGNRNPQRLGYSRHTGGKS